MLKCRCSQLLGAPSGVVPGLQIQRLGGGEPHMTRASSTATTIYPGSKIW